MEEAVMPDAGVRKWWALAALSLAVLAAGLDATVLVVALPTLATALHASESDLQWFSSGYLLTLAAGMLPAGLLGDRYGRRKVMLGALVLFAVGSVACAEAPSTALFIAARAVLGAAGAGVVVMALSAITVLFAEDERPRAVGIWAAANFLAAPVGPILGGWLLTHYWWGWVFLINVPVAAIAVTAVITLVPESRAQQRPGLDVVGIITSTAGLVALTYGFVRAGDQGWSDAGAWVAMGIGVVVLIAFAAWERRLAAQPGGQPLIELALFTSPSYTWGVVLVSVAVLAMIGVLFTMPQYFQGILGTEPMGSGLRLLPLIGGLIIGALPADRVARLIGVKITVVAGFALMAAGALLGATTGVESGTGFLALWMTIVGAGMGLAMATATSAALSRLSGDRSGVGSAVLQAANKVGGPFGSAILGSVLAATFRARLDVSSLPPGAGRAAQASVFAAEAIARQMHSATLLSSARSAFLRGMDNALIVSAGIAVAGLILAAVFLPARETSEVIDRAPSREVDVAPPK
jgi:EmrB/QacA subfamily drug resistance transporter